MKRIAYLALLMAGACTTGLDTGTASLTGVTPAPKSATVTAFEGEDGTGTKVLGWKIEFFEEAPGQDCLSAELNVVAKIGIYTKDAAGSKPQSLLSIGGITIVTQSPPTVLAAAAAVMSADGVGMIQGQLTIDEFHLTPDAMHVDHIKGTVSAAGTDGNGGAVNLDGAFDSGICVEK